MKLKRRQIKIGICIFFFLSLLVAVNRLLDPVYKSIGSQIQKTVESYRAGLKDASGLELFYKSLSPSVLSGINVNGISVVDAKSGVEVASIGRLSLGYSFRPLLSGNLSQSLKSLSLRDVEIKLYCGENDFWLSEILERRKAAGGAAAEEKTPAERFREFFEGFDAERLSLSLGADIKVFRLRFLFKDADTALEAVVSKAFVGASGGGKIDATVSGSFEGNSGGKKVAGSLDFSALLPRGLDGSSAVLRFSNISALNWSGRFIGFLAEYKDKVLSFKMLPSARNIYAEASADFKSGAVGAKLFADGFNLSNLVQTSRGGSVERGLFAMNFSLDASAKYNYKSGEFGYSSSGDIFVPGSVIPDKRFQSDTVVSYSLSGDRHKITVPYFKTSGERYNLSFDGSFDFAAKRPNGTLGIDSVVLPNGGEILAEIFIDDYQNGFMCFAPQIFLGQNVFTAAELTVLPSADSWDWTFEASDYSHDGEPGTLSLFGSYSPETKAFQSSISFGSVYVDSVIKTAAFFAQENVQPLLLAASDAAKVYVFSFDAFASGLGREYSFSVPYAIVANTGRDDQMLILEADGNNQTFQLSRLEFIFGGQKILMDALAERFPESPNRLLTGRLDLNGIPYSFSGLVNKGWVEINSEYGLRFTLNTDTSGKVASLNGAFEAAGFPVKLNDRTFSFTSESSFSYSVDKGLRALVPYFDGRLLEGTSALNPVLTFSANIDSSGAYFDSVAYSDSVSTLNGNGACLYSFDGNSFEAADFSFDLSNSLGLEKVSLQGNIVNSLKTPLSVGSLISGAFAKSLFVAASLNVDSLRSARFFAGSEESDAMSASANIQGQLSNPFVAVDIPRAVMTIQGKPLNLSAQAFVEDWVLSVQKAEADWGDSVITNVSASFDKKTWDGSLSFDVDTRIFGKAVSAQARAKVEAMGDVGSGIPDSLNIEFDAEEKGIDKKSAKKFHVGAMKIQDQVILSSSPNIGLSGSVSNWRDLDLEIQNSVPFNMKITGSAAPENLALNFSDIKINARPLLESLGIEIAKIYKGTAQGEFSLVGPLSNPGFYGQIDIPDAEFNFPNFFKKRASTPLISLALDGSQFYTEPTRCSLQGQPLDVTVNVQMNRLAFESLEARIQTIDENYVPLNLNLSEMHVKGDFLTDMAVVYENGAVGVSGELTAKNANAEFGATRLNEIISGLSFGGEEEEEDGSPVDVDLHIKMGKRVQISYTTFLRAAIVPGAEIDVSYSGDDKRLSLDGDVPIRSGEIVYLNSSFYIKEGEIHFSDDDESFDPRVSLLAECKARDSNSENVTISLEVDNQRLSQLNPRLSASPAKSEREIMEILGGIMTGNSNSAAALALATGDYAIQTVFIRRLENALRDFFKFDIFSVRTMVVQNAVKQGVSRNSSDSGNAAGNYLDGTTVYIGKYFGESLFADGMLRFEYDKNRVGNDYTYDGLTIRPEIGFELAAPFARIRWSMAPDLESIMNMRLVENTALTLSWKFSF